MEDKNIFTEYEKRLPKIKNLAISTIEEMIKLNFTNSDFESFVYYLHTEHSNLNFVKNHD